MCVYAVCALHMCIYVCLFYVHALCLCIFSCLDLDVCVYIVYMHDVFE